MPKSDPQLDALVLGGHPAAYLCAALLQHKSKLRVLHTTIPEEHCADRLVILNPKIFELHPLLEPLRRKVELSGIYGVRFLSDQAGVGSEFRNRSVMAFTASFKNVRAATIKLAEAQNVEMVSPKTLEIHRVDENGIELSIGKSMLYPKMLVLAGMPSELQAKILGLPDSWGPDVVHRYTYLRLSGAKWADLGTRPVMPMSLNLKEMLCWGWLLPAGKGIQLAVEQPVETLSKIAPNDLLSHWIGVLRAHRILPEKPQIPLEECERVDLPLAGALVHEGVANRTLLIGPAGGFYSATAEDLYPNCWSALFAADTVKKALKEVHLQDALQAYRHKWRTSLGDYLRGPQQNLRFLLPLVYRNQVMTTRLTESILQGKSVVR